MGCRAEFVGVEAVTQTRKPAALLTANDFEVSPVWEFVAEPRDNENETWMTPVLSLPVDDLSGRVVRTSAKLADGSEFAAVLANVDLQDARKNAHFVMISIERDGTRFLVARYHDENWDTDGPVALARFLDRPVDQVFPISYDITQFASGAESTVRGLIHAEPAERLSNAELMDLILG